MSGHEALPLRPLAGGEGRGEVGGGAAPEAPAGHLTLPHLRRGPLPLPRGAAERGLCRRFRQRIRPAFLAAAIVAGFPAASAWACADFSAAPSTRWSLTKQAGASWLVTPCGERFFSLGVNVLDGGYPEREKAGRTWYSSNAL